MKKPRLESPEKKREFAKNIFISSIPIVLFFLLWQFAAARIPKGVLASPLRIAQGMHRAFADPKGEILKHTFISLNHIGMGFLLAGAVGAALGFLLSSFFRPLERLFLPFLHLCEKLNPFAIVPVFMLLFGIGEKQKVMVVFWACLWPVRHDPLHHPDDHSCQPSPGASGKTLCNLEAEEFLTPGPA
jgi:NitT/TauT family transport system permease protein